MKETIAIVTTIVVIGLSLGGLMLDGRQDIRQLNQLILDLTKRVVRVETIINERLPEPVVGGQVAAKKRK